MERYDTLPEPPLHHIRTLEDCSEKGPGFLRRVSRRLCIEDEQGSRSRDFLYDEVARRCLDAVVIVPHFVAERASGQPTLHVVLRSAIRPPVALRSAERSPMQEPENRALWEFPAGLVEPEEESPEGIARAAARELLEETGFAVAPDQLVPLGPSTFPAPGVIAERHFFYHVRVDPQRRTPPSLDGSPLEEAGRVVAVPWDAALQAARAGRLADAKTELCLFRLGEALGVAVMGAGP